VSRLELPNEILLEEIEDGLLVRQGAEAYVARNWCLSLPVVELVTVAMEAGLSWMIRNEHPRRNARWPNRRGVVYLAFSPSEHQQRSMAIDTVRPKSGDFGHGVFNGKYHEQFLTRGLPFTFEKRNKGAGHLVVSREHVLPTLRALGEFDHSVLDLGRVERNHSGFATEYEIQRAILNQWRETPFATSHVIVQDEYPVDGGLNSRRIDVLAQSPESGDWLVIEIKRAEANLDAVRQVEEYLLALGKKDEFAFGKLEGVLIAERISVAVRDAALHAGISAYEVKWPLGLRQVA
jgi:hypothetical protein